MSMMKSNVRFGLRNFSGKRIPAVFLFGLFLLFTGRGMAQHFTGGVRAGMSMSQISGDDLSGFHKLGAYAGGYVQWRFVSNDRWALQPELNFNMKGSSTYLKADRNGNVIGQKYVLSLYYLEVPLLVKFRPVKGFEVELGPSFGVLFAENERDANGKMPSRVPFRFCDFSALAGVSYLIKEHYGLSFRYEQTLIPVRVNDGRHSAYRLNKKQFSSVLLVSFFYQFGGKNTRKSEK